MHVTAGYLPPGKTTMKIQLVHIMPVEGGAYRYELPYEHYVEGDSWAGSHAATRERIK